MVLQRQQPSSSLQCLVQVLATACSQSSFNAPCRQQMTAQVPPQEGPEWRSWLSAMTMQNHLHKEEIPVSLSLLLFQTKYNLRKKVFLSVFIWDLALLHSKLADYPILEHYFEPHMVHFQYISLFVHLGKQRIMSQVWGPCNLCWTPRQILLDPWLKPHPAPDVPIIGQKTPRRQRLSPLVTMSSSVSLSTFEIISF